MGIQIALVGNPNSGKTTLFNYLTGSTQYVGNWPGVTVEQKSGPIKGHKNAELIDLPGIYSLSPYTLEEIVSRDYLLSGKPNVIVNIVDASNIERNLYLTTQLLEMGIPIVVALNMMDVVVKNGDSIDIAKLSRELGCKVVETSALKGTGCSAVIEAALQAHEEEWHVTPRHVFSKEVELALEQIAIVISNKVDINQARWFSVKLFERDEKAKKDLNLTDSVSEKIEELICECETALDDDSESCMANDRYTYIGGFIGKSVKKDRNNQMSASDKIDKIVTNRILALPIFAAVMFLVYYLSISTIGAWGTDWVNDSLFGEIIPASVETFLVAAGTAEWLNSLILDGIIGGVGAVLGFLPQMLVLFFCLAILEDCGYMARIAFIMDRVFRKFGLSGKSFIPMLVGTGCGVPGIMASRTIENERDRKMTIITTTFIPCSAKLPIIALIAGALFPGSAWVAPSAYFIGIGAILVSGIILKKTAAFSGDCAPFVMELPAYHLPTLRNVITQMFDRGKAFVKKAGTIIFLASGAIWFLSSFSWAMEMADAPDSMLAGMGNVIAPIFSPLGWGDWKATVATITGLIAKENVVGTFGVLYGVADVAEDGAEIWANLQRSFTPISAYSFLIFNLLCAPCFAAIGAIRREMGSAKWTAIAIGYQTGFAYAVSFIFYQLGLLATGGTPKADTAAAILLLAFFIYLLVRPHREERTTSTAVKKEILEL